MLADEAVERVECWLEAASTSESRREHSTARRLADVVSDRPGTAFAMRFVDRVVRPEDPAVSARQLASLVAEAELPAFLSPVDRLLLRVGARLGPAFPRVVMPIARRRMRALVGHLVVDSQPERLAAHLQTRAAAGYSLNVNMLGEAVLGDAEARRRHQEVLRTLAQPDVDYVSVKVSAVVSQLNPWDFDGSLQRVVEALRPLLRAAAATAPPTFINLDMEEYHDLELTAAAFRELLQEPEFAAVDAGIALQAYLPDCFGALQGLVDWHNGLVTAGGRSGTIKIRLVKGANLAMERVEAAMHGWLQAPYRSKAETDASYKRCLDWVLTGERTAFGAHRGGQPQPVRRGLGRPAGRTARGFAAGWSSRCSRAWRPPRRSCCAETAGGAAVHARSGRRGFRCGHRLPVPAPRGERVGGELHPPPVRPRARQRRLRGRVSQVPHRGRRPVVGGPRTAPPTGPPPRARAGRRRGGVLQRAGHRSRAGTQPGVGPRDRLPAMERPGHAPQPDH